MKAEGGGKKWNKEEWNVASDVLQKHLTFICFSWVQPRQSSKGHQSSLSAAGMLPYSLHFRPGCKQPLQYTEQINQWAGWKHLLFVRPRKINSWSNSCNIQVLRWEGQQKGISWTMLRVVRRIDEGPASLCSTTCESAFIIDWLVSFPGKAEWSWVCSVS